MDDLDLDLDEVLKETNDFLNKLRPIFLEENKKIYPKRLFKISNWPKVSVPEDERPPKKSKYYHEDENLDVENYAILDFNGEHLEMVCHGDWQDPQRVVLKLIDGQLKVIYHDNLLEDEVIQTTNTKNFLNLLKCK